MLRAEGVLARRPAFGPLAKRLRDRINALSYFYCGEGLDIDFKAFGEQAEKITTVADSTRWVESSRYSRRREVTHDLSGFVGEVTFEGDLGMFLPYLKLGEYLHVGKNAVFGNGWYRNRACRLTITTKLTKSTKERSLAAKSAKLEYLLLSN